MKSEKEIAKDVIKQILSEGINGYNLIDIYYREISIDGFQGAVSDLLDEED